MHASLRKLDKNKIKKAVTFWGEFLKVEIAKKIFPQQENTQVLNFSLFATSVCKKLKHLIAKYIYT